MGEREAGHGGGSHSHPSRRVSVFLVILGAVAAAIGLVLLLLPSNQASFGWYAYAPLGDSTFFPPAGLLSPQSQIGMVVFIVGLVALAFGAGWMLGLRNAASRSE
ncbi:MULTISPECIES: hypothetical protein [unclassified Cryobacterium]|uniref:hypothetical protein n=1 Tax=unclassified Cryobacterium TaxID=2649013 RepID=UPI002AB4560E|nr:MULTISPECIES: hypothetical protein [unclassified Cryobacterium]MDY7541745.1 hypothetical protein [Cryobacterium sp. 5B3]MEB0000196.1 hypothetical protein [Cryobacterium sp. RTS3]MEB0266668.1 hypothetical protein [Cryobacterium sp. 10I5]MEB0275857.1 hypothetical protein [Cryobacterium sp. 5B3]